MYSMCPIMSVLVLIKARVPDALSELIRHVGLRWTGRGILAAIFLPHLSLLPQTSSASPWEDRAGCQNSGRRLALASLTMASSQPALISLSGAPTHHLPTFSTLPCTHPPRTPGKQLSSAIRWQKLGPGNLWEGRGGRCPRGGCRRH